VQSKSELFALKRAIDASKEKILKEWNAYRQIGQVKGILEVDLETLYYIAPEQDIFYIKMKYCAKGSLWSEMRCRLPNPLPFFEARSFFAQLCHVVHYLATRRLYHRDLKLENILIDGDGTLIICDVTRLCYCPDGQTVGFHGTKEYASPESSSSGTSAYSVEKSDCFSLGRILNHLAHNDKTAWSLINSLLDVDPANRPSLAKVLQHPYVARCPLPCPVPPALQSSASVALSTATTGRVPDTQTQDVSTIPAESVKMATAVKDEDGGDEVKDPDVDNLLG